jgi:hypothetical protein
MENMSGISTPLATFTHGQGKRKPSGSFTFETVNPRDSFYNQDALWVGKGEKAEVTLAEGVTFEVLEKTLMIFKKPFRSDINVLILGSKSQIFMGENKKSKETLMNNLAKGKIRVKGEGSTIRSADGIMQQAGKIPEIPKEDREKGPAVSQIGIYPKPNTAIFLKELTDVPILFAWPTASTGYLACRDLKTSHTLYFPIQNQTSIMVKLPSTNSSYLWQLIDPQKQVTLGPFRFDLRPLSVDSARSLLKGGPKKSTDIYW